MYFVSDELREVLNDQRHTINLIVGDTTIEDVISCTYTASCCGSDTISIGSVCSASVQMSISGEQNLLNQEIQVIVQCSGETIPLGEFLVTDCSRNEGVTTLTAYDALYWATSNDYVPTVDSGASVTEVLKDILSQLDTAVTIGVLPSTAISTSVSGTLSGKTCREMLGLVAALVGRNVILDRDGEIQLVWFAPCDVTITPDDYYSGGFSQGGSHRLAIISTTKNVTETSVDEDGNETPTETTVTLSSGDGTGTGVSLTNSFFTQEILDNVWNEIGGMEYSAGTCSIFGGMLITPGDLVTVIDSNEDIYNLPVTSVVLTLDGGCKAEISAAGQSNADFADAFTGGVNGAIKRVEADVGAFKKLTAEELHIHQEQITNSTVDSMTPYYSESEELVAVDEPFLLSTNEPLWLMTDEWLTEQPSSDENKSVWVSYEIKYKDGSTKRTDPVLLTDNYIQSVVSTLGADLSVVKDSITTKVWQTDITNAVNPISGDVETLQDQYSQLTQTVEGFDAEISSVKSTVSENYEELDEKMTSISATADGITSTVSSLQTKVDNRSYENRNYILLSGDYEAGGETGWTCESTTAAQYLSITTYDGYTQLKKVKIHSGTIFYLMEIDFSQELDNNAEYTLSMRVRPSVAADIFTVLKTASGSKKNLNTFSSSLFTANEWTEISYTFTTDSASYVKLCINESSINSVGRTLDVAWAKLEKGSEVTNWSRAPEDYATNTSVESKIEQLADSITLSVSGGLGDTAIIKLAVGDEEQTKTLDMSDIRQKFAEDTSSVTVSGGTVTFEAGKLLINGGNFTLDTDGKMTAKDGVFTGTITAKAGTIGGLTVSTSSDSTDHVYKNTIYTQTIGIEETVRSGDGTATVTVDTQFGMKPASSRLSDLALYLLAKLNGTQEWTNDIALFSVNHRGKVKCSGIDLYSDRSMGYQNNELLAPENSGNGAPLLISTDNNRLYLNNVIFREKGATGECNGIISDIDPRFGATDYNDTDGQDMGGAEYPWRRIYVRRIYRDDESSISDRKDKKDISPIPENSTDLIMNLKPVQYRWNRGTDNRLHWGFVAQEVAHAAQNTVGDISVFQAVRKGTKNEEHNTDYESIPDSELQWYLSYQELIAPMVSTIQEQERRIERLERMLEKYGVHE